MICNAIQSICTSEIRRVIRSAAIFCHGEMHFSVASVAWLVGDFYISTVSLVRLVNFEYLWNINIVHLIFLASEKLEMTSGRGRLALPPRNPWLLVSEIFPTCKI